MTLDTRIYVKSAVDHRALFAECNRLLRAHEGIQADDDGQCISNAPAQGLDAWLMIYYGSPLRDGVCPRMPHDPDDDDECWDHHKPACYAEVSFDTAYSYQTNLGGCGDFHAWLIAELGRWLDERHLAWSWRNEFTGDIFDRYAGLTELGQHGANASEWFRTAALPAIIGQISNG